MKIICISLVFVFVSCYSPERDCQSYKLGQFKYEVLLDGNIKETIFIRNDSLQVEVYDGKTDTSKIRWINDCEFILTPVNPKSILDQYQMHMKIINTTDNTYTFQYNVVGEKQKETGIAERVNIQK